jgi:hypothetical protein
MSLSNSTLRNRLIHSTPRGAADRALAILDSQEVEASKLNPVCNTAGDLLNLWKTREITSRHGGFVIPGLSDLNARLDLLPPSSQVEQYNFDSESSSGSIFIDSATGEFLGDTIVERHNKSQQMIEFEDQLFRPSRKSA